MAAFVSSKSPFRGSAIYRMLSHARWQRKQGARFQSGMQANGDVPRRYLLYEDQPAPPWDAAWRSFERVVEEFSSEALAHGARYVLLNVPAGQVVNRDAWQDLVADYPAMAQRTWKLSDPESRLKELAARLEVPVVSDGALAGARHRVTLITVMESLAAWPAVLASRRWTTPIVKPGGNGDSTQI